MMNKWKCEICGNEFENFHAQGFDNKIYCPLCYFKKENQKLETEKEQLNSLVNSCQEEIRRLKKQLEEYKKELAKADSITQSCIFNGKKESEISFRQCLNMLKELKQEKQEWINLLGMFKNQ